MSVLDRFIAAVTPSESAEARLEACTKATDAAMPGDRLDQILEHHMDVEDAFADVKATGDSAARTATLKQLGLLLTGHAIADESLVYPALAEGGEKTHAGMDYDEQAMVKVQMALLEKLDPMRGFPRQARMRIGTAISCIKCAHPSRWLPPGTCNLPPSSMINSGETRPPSSRWTTCCAVLGL